MLTTLLCCRRCPVLRLAQKHAVLQPVIGQQQEMLVCILDNRGVGHSSSPLKAEAYSTQHMAQDVLAVMDHLRWGSAHVLGFSMGGFIAQALAVAAPQRVLSLTLLASSAGGLQIVPSSWSGLRVALKMVMARCVRGCVFACCAVVEFPPYTPKCHLHASSWQGPPRPQRNGTGAVLLRCPAGVQRTPWMRRWRCTSGGARSLRG
jgi:pimeloyl-ACP methyl ester carboxylesterase